MVDFICIGFSEFVLYVKSLISSIEIIDVRTIEQLNCIVSSI